MKKNIFILTLGLSLLISPLSTFATSDTGVILNDSTISQDNKVKWEKEAKERDKIMEEWAIKEEAKLNKKKDSGDIGTYDLPGGTYYGISVSNFEQANWYYCGPAAVQQTLSFHKSKIGSGTSLPSQYTLANLIGTTESGSASTGIRNALNTYKGTFGFSANPYGVADISNVSNPTATFEWRIKYVLSNRINAPVILLQTKYLPRYAGESIRHYNTVSGYSHDASTGAKTIRTVDPHYNDYKRGIYWDPMGSTTSNGVVKAVYYADIAGSNYAMIY